MNNKIQGKYFYAEQRDNKDIYYIFRFDGYEPFGRYWPENDARQIMGAFDNLYKEVEGGVLEKILGELNKLCDKKSIIW